MTQHLMLYIYRREHHAAVPRGTCNGRAAIVLDEAAPEPGNPLKVQCGLCFSDVEMDLVYRQKLDVSIP